MKTSFRLTAVLLLGLLVLVAISGCTGSNTTTNTASGTDTTPSLNDNSTNTSVDTTAQVLGDSGDSGVTASDLDDLQSDLDQIDSEVAGVSETN